MARGATLGFDRLGRLAVTYEGAYVVLNDTTWINFTQPPSTIDRMRCMAYATDGKSYYGALGSWGTVEFTTEGKLSPISLRPERCPPWVAATHFERILITDNAVYFSGWNGVVRLDRATGEHAFFALRDVTQTFRVGDQVFVSSRTAGLYRLEVKSRTLQRCLQASLINLTIDDGLTDLDDHRVLLATTDRRLMAFDGQQATPWDNAFGECLPERVLDLQRLPDGRFALALREHGLYILSPRGEILLSLMHDDYRGIRQVVAREPGILWVATENRIEKIFYGSSVTTVDQRLGLRVSWPQVVQLRGRPFVASGGRLYEAVSAPMGAATRFELARNPPGEDIWGIAVSNDQLLVGNSRGVFTRQDNGDFEPAVLGIRLGRLVAVGPDLCLAIGEKEIAALRRVDGRWVECAPRVPGLGYPNRVEISSRAAWIELGANRVARVALCDGTIETRLFEPFPWSPTSWINIGVVGQTVVLIAPNFGCIFFDEESETLRDDPRLRDLLESAPVAITRLQEEAGGTLWASHDNGVLRFVPHGDDYVMDLESLAMVPDANLQVQFAGQDDVWLASGPALYHVDPRQIAPASGPLRPILASVTDRRTGEQVPISAGPPRPFPRLPYASNSLSFRFFAGTYALRASGYEFRMGGASGWTPLGADSLLTLPELREGAYSLDVRLADVRGPVGQPISFTLQIAPPWYRSWLAYVGYCVLGLTLVAGVIGWSVRRVRLRRKMALLPEETRQAAVLAERNRLAGEIHDGLQQGLNGLMLQVDATLKLPSLPTEVKSRLDGARKMISFTRREVKHAVWDLESPFLEGGDLHAALQKIGALIGPGTNPVEVNVAGPAYPLPPQVQHHLLRIAQEAVYNAFRHGHARRIIVSLRYKPDRVLLQVVDDGCGFESRAVPAQDPGHFGLRGLRARVGKINGELRIESAPGCGTSVSVSAPTSPAFHPTHATSV